MRRRVMPLAVLVVATIIALGARADTIFTDTVESLRFSPRGFAAWGDFNNDGWVDLYANGMLWRNDSGKGFARVADSTFDGYGDNSITGPPGEVIANWGDFDNDGFLDLYVAGSGQLYRNIEGKAFVDVTDMLPERPILEPQHPMVCRGAAWGDFDGDGFLDLYVGGYEDLEAKTQSEFPDLILKNNGGESFTEIWRQPGKPWRARGITAADFDEDGNMDVYVSNYRLQPNLLWRGDGTGTFTDLAVEYGAAGDGGLGAWGHTIGSAFADMDNDGHLDIFVGNFSHPPDYQDRPKFLRNRGPEGDYHFEDMSANAGLAWQESFSTPALGDYDNDGNLDLFYTTDYNNGDKSVLYRNNGDWTFTNVTEQAGVATTCTDQGAWADYDNDGDLDLASGGRLFVNTGNDHHWLKIRLVGSSKVNRAAIGSQVRVHLDGKTLTRHVSPSTGEGNQNDLTLHFGLGHHDKDVTMLIRWTDGTTRPVTTPVDRTITVTRAP